MLLLVGLGNPGARYVGNRHNIGFRVVQAIAQRHGIGPWRRRFQGVATEGTIGGERVLLLLPGTYMNESGRAVAEAAHFYKLPLDHITVFHDEIDLPAGKVRVKVGGGIAGHNGLRSISEHIGNDYRRVRIGVGHPGSKERARLGRGAHRRPRRQCRSSRPRRGRKFSEQSSPRHGRQGIRRNGSGLASRRRS
jgi:PTH1 family peptidyl-tRNA hydrolase